MHFNITRVVSEIIYFISLSSRIDAIITNVWVCLYNIAPYIISQGEKYITDEISGKHDKKFPTDSAWPTGDIVT